MKRLSFRRIETGFTIIELLASVAIIGILATVAVPVVQTTITRQKEAQLRTALMSIRSAIDAYKQAQLNGNITLLDGQTGYPPTLTALSGGVQNAIYGKTDNTLPQQLYFLRRIPADPFFPDPTAPAVSTWELRDFASDADTFNPAGTTTLPDVYDIRSSSTQVGLNGIPYNEW